MNASIAACASRNVRPRPSFPTPRAIWPNWLKLNADYANVWPNITIKREPPADAKEFDGVPDKLARHFSPAPGQGD